MYAIFVAGDRIKPRDDIPTDAERIELFKTMIAYSGTYTVDALKVVHHVDISWNGARIGSDQVRFYTLEGDTLTIKTALNKSPIDGREGVGVLVFQRIKWASGFVRTQYPVSHSCASRTGIGPLSGSRSTSGDGIACMAVRRSRPVRPRFSR
jgi:hypothetical protein